MKNFCLKNKNNVPQTIVCLGDSITFGYQTFTKLQVKTPYPLALQSLLHNCHVVNSGFSGYRSCDILPNLEEYVYKFRPDLCIVMLGINDARGSQMGLGLSLKQYLDNIKAIITDLKLHNIECLILTPTLTHNLRVNFFHRSLIKMLAAEEVDFIDMKQVFQGYLKTNQLMFNEVFLDNIHLKDDLYQVISQAVYAKIRDFKE